ncbi:MAG: hypothetical protein WC756_01080 [Taibaiella sp.]|jgi:hypothetical protein
MTTEKQIPETLGKSEMAAWFDNLLDDVTSAIRTDQLMMETDTASKSTISFYDALFSKNDAELMKQFNTLYSKVVIRELLFGYIDELKSIKKLPKRLAMDLSEGKILVWAEINEDDEEVENALLLTEAKLNAKFAGKGLHLSSFIVEESDHFPIPNHYQEVRLPSLV